MGHVVGRAKHRVYHRRSCRIEDRLGQKPDTPAVYGERRDVGDLHIFYHTGLDRFIVRGDVHFPLSYSRGGSGGANGDTESDPAGQAGPGVRLRAKHRAGSFPAYRFYDRADRAIYFLSRS